MGIVYEARDRQHNMNVALKTLRQLEATNLYRFKREFRAVSDLSHPNIVSLYELVAHDGQWFFTMEVVRGGTIIDYVRSGPGRQVDTITPSEMRLAAHGGDTGINAVVMTAASAAKADVRDRDDDADADIPHLTNIADVRRVRRSFGQLAQALHALHQNGLVHRDLKPSNVRVTERGRVVLMDFGIVAERSQSSTHKRATHTAGTPAYMAPEQATGEAPNAEADWYAFGVLLYFALAGRLPYDGRPREILWAKLRRPPPPLASLVRGVPDDLAELCRDLLHRKPQLRPEPSEILHALGATESGYSRQIPEVFVGRDEQLSELHDAYAVTAAGQAVTVFVTGASGMGKSTLIRRFLTQLEAGVELAMGPLVLSGRCHARESLPYNAFDGVLDGITQVLLGMAEADVSALLPPDIALLARLFPILHRLPQLGVDSEGVSPKGGGGGENEHDEPGAIGADDDAEPTVQARPRTSVRRHGRPNSDSGANPRELRSRASAALKALVGVLAERRPVVIFLDDLQWADRGSLELLADIVDRDTRVLVVAAQRPEGPGSGIWKAMQLISAKTECRHLSIGPLSAVQRRELIDRLAGEQGREWGGGEQLAALDSQGLSEQLCDGSLAHDSAPHSRPGPPAPPMLDSTDRLWAESGGCPLLLVELFRVLDEVGVPSDRRPLNLEQVLYWRIERLPNNARDLLEAVAVAGEPTPLWLLSEAARVSAELSQRALTLLYTKRLIQIVKPGPDHWLMTYHARVRDTVLGRLPSARLTAIHQHIAQALERWDRATLNARARHWRAAGNRDKARAYLIAAAAEAEVKLAFDHAADLYRAALELADPESNLLDLLRRLGNALQLAGESYEAAQIYQQAARRAEARNQAVQAAGLAGESKIADARAETLHLKQLAADNWLRSGHIQRGLECLTDVLTELRAPYARTRLGAMASAFLQRIRLRLRGLGYRTRAVDALSPHDLVRIDTLYAAATSLGLIDHLRGKVLQNRHVLAALELGEERRICRALAIECVYLGAAGGRKTRRADVLIGEVLSLAQRIGDPYLIGIALLARGTAEFYTSRSPQAVLNLQQCDELLSRAKRAVEWERATARYMLSRAQIAIGDFAGAARTAERYARDAERRNDVYARTMFMALPGTWSLLRSDQCEEAERKLDTVLDGWPDDGYYVANYVEVCSRAMVGIYRGEGASIVQLVERALPNIRKTLIMRHPWVRSEVYTLVASAALHAGDLDRAGRAVAVVGQCKMTFIEGVAALLRASLAARRGRDDRARAELDTALARFGPVSARHMVAACHIRLGQLLSGRQGDELIARGRGVLREIGVRAPERMLNLLAPGFGGDRPLRHQK